MANWIAGATENSHGQFRAKAKAAGMSTEAYARKEEHAPGKTGAQARLALTLMGMKHPKKTTRTKADTAAKLYPKKD